MVPNIGGNANRVTNQTHSILTQNTKKQNKSMFNTTTGKVINSAGDSPSQWAVSARMRERINSLNQANKNVQNDTNMMKAAEDGINNTVSILQTLKARVLQAADASTSDNDRVALSKEIYQLLGQVDENATSTRYNGKLLLTQPDDMLDGDFDSTVTAVGTAGATASQVLTFQIGENTGAVISNVKIANMTVKGLGLDEIYTATKAVFNEAVASNQVTLAQLAIGFTGLQTAATTQADTAAGKTLEVLDAALNKALAAATDVGTYEQRLGYASDNVSAQIENLEASESTITDADMAKEISDYMKYNVQVQAAQYMLAQGNQNRFQVLNLLQ